MAKSGIGTDIALWWVKLGSPSKANNITKTKELRINKELKGQAPQGVRPINKMEDKTMMYPVLRNAMNWLDNFDNMFNDNWMPRMSVTAPAINVKENKNEYDIELAAPGTTKEDFNVNLDNDGNLVIKMEHKDEKKNEDKKEHYLRREFSYSNYEQALTLPDDVNRDGIKANVENGVLHVTLPRTAQAQKETKRIEVA